MPLMPASHYSRLSPNSDFFKEKNNNFHIEKNNLIKNRSQNTDIGWFIDWKTYQFVGIIGRF